MEFAKRVFPNCAKINRCPTPASGTFKFVLDRTAVSVDDRFVARLEFGIICFQPDFDVASFDEEIGRASCRVRV